MSDLGSYEKLAKVDFKCLEHEIYKMNSGEENPKLLFEKLLEIIDPLEDKRCDYIGQCIENRDYESVKECKKCKGYWFTTDETFTSYYKMWQEWKKRPRVDPDDSNNSRANPFIRAVYYLLWGKRIVLGGELEVNSGIYKYGWERFSTSYVFEDMSKPKALLFGSDTMNTIKSYQKEIENFLEQEKKEIEKVNELCRKCHQLGNFVLVPAYYNGCRGAMDRIDVALDRLRDGKNFDGGFKGRTKLRPSGNVTKAEKEKVADTYFYRWDKNYFTEFINMFFLWDYVETDKEKTGYYVKNMRSNGELVTSNTNVNEGNIEKYIANANAYIERRGIFMAAMLEIAVKDDKGVKIDDSDYKDNWGGWDVSAIYKYIVKKVFLADETEPDHNKVIKMYSDYNEVIEAIKGAIKQKKDGEIPQDIKSILDNAQEEIDKIGRCK